MDHRSNQLFAKTPIWKLFFMAAIPGAISMLASSLHELFDGMFVGQILGETAFAAINLAFPFVIINFSLADLIGVGSSVNIAIRLGRKEEKEANNIFTCAVLMIIATGASIGTVLYLVAPLLIRLMGAEGQLAADAVTYIRVYAVCSPVTTMIYAMDNYLRTSGIIRGSMMLNIFMSFLTIVLAFLFLYHFQLGMAGAALATCSGMFVCSLIAILAFATGRLQLKFCRPRFSPALVLQVFRSGIPSFFGNISGQVTSIIMNFTLLRMGGPEAVSIFGAIMYTRDAIQPIFYGMCDSLQPAIGYNWGAGNHKRVRSLRKVCLLAGFIISMTAMAVLLLIPAPVASLYIQKTDTALVQAAASAMQIFALCYTTRWYGFTTQSFLVAIDQHGPAALLSICNAFVFPVLWILLLQPLGLNGIWLNYFATSTSMAILAFIVITYVKRKFKTHPEQIPLPVNEETPYADL